MREVNWLGDAVMTTPSIKRRGEQLPRTRIGEAQDPQSVLEVILRHLTSAPGVDWGMLLLLR